ncbi:uncharacterized protein LOC107980855 [Nasonia vitripennis]|uniref:CUB domain-containing protein n=1 Tax=Nasonia vitripennis TaxID=7425 RepID=A0A7M7T6G3_NASVI|nr:uncharacterized protein LOC107980855 [Nasonia vitripennis]
MCSKLLCMILLCLSFSKKSYGFNVKWEDKGYPVGSTRGRDDTYILRPDLDCKQHILSNHTRILSLHIVDNLPVNCSWIIYAGPGERVYINELLYIFTAFEGFSYKSKNFFVDDALNVNIYDGNQVNESKRLHKLGDKKFENVISTGRNLTITLDFRKSDVYERQFLDIQIAYISSMNL